MARKLAARPAKRAQAPVLRRPGQSASVPLLPAIVIENVQPAVDGGRFPVKCLAGDSVTVRADIFRDGHSVLAASLLYRPKAEADWIEVPMREDGNDRWSASFVAWENARYVYTVCAWTDPVRTWLADADKKARYGMLAEGDLAEGLNLLKKIAPRLDATERAFWHAFLIRLGAAAAADFQPLAADTRFSALLLKYPLKEDLTFAEREFELAADRRAAEVGAWYEMFPRSQAGRPGRSGTFRDCAARLEDIKRMGFSVVYLPPIHPIGRTHRKGPNNTPGGPDAVGSPWAIGGPEGGHKAVHPELGTLEEFERLAAEAREQGLEIALDFAIQCSPDHPYVREHPEWFRHRPDGSIHYAENPPKKYEDIYPLDFRSLHEAGLVREMKSILEFWIARGVRIFRVDNPHTKPLAFWKRLIEEIQAERPDIVFLSEAFTRPKVMDYLAKAGFSQSYTYFTWRNTKAELRGYLEELASPEKRLFFRPNFFTNTPDILTDYLQKGGPAAFKVRLVLAATLSASYGIYSGFELCENAAVREGSEEYLDSEKYQIKIRDWDRPGNIKDFIARVNRIRAENAALRRNGPLLFLDSYNDRILAYVRRTPDLSNRLVVVVNLDPFRPQEDSVRLPLGELGLESGQTFEVKDLLTGEKYWWKGEWNYVRLDPEREPAHIFRVRA